MKLNYTKYGDYYLPNLILSEKENKPLNKYGLLKLNYLKQYKKSLYQELLMKEKLNEYLFSVSNNALEKLEFLMKQLINNDTTITEELKEKDPLLWTQKMNSLKSIAEEFIVPEAVAFYLANGYIRNCLSSCPLTNHINSAIDVFNINCNIDKILSEIKKILRIKYNLKIVKNNPLKIEKLY